MTTPTEAEWLGLLLITESNEPHEWPWIARVVENRVGHPRWPDTIRDVVLQPWQFSHFNPYQDWESPDQYLYESIINGERGRPLSRAWLARAIEFAESWLSPGLVFYYSPISMQPRDSEPWWWEQEVGRAYTPPGIETRRFIFGEMA